MTSSNESYGPNSRPDSGVAYTESLRRLKDGILLEGRLSGIDLQHCLLMIGVPLHECPNPEQLTQRLGIASLGQSTPLLDTPSNTLERKNKKRFVSLKKVHRPKIFRSKGDKISDTQDTAEFVITQLLHSCLQLLSLEATHQTSPHAPLSPQLTVPSFSLLDEMDEGKKKLTHTQSDLAWAELDREGENGREEHSVEVEQLRRELGEVKRSRDEMEFRYIETRDRCSLLDAKEHPEPMNLAYRGTQETDFLNSEIFRLRQDNDTLQRSLHNAEAYASHIEAKYDELSVRLGNYQMQLTNALNANHDMSVQMAKSSSLANLAASAHPAIHLSERSPHTHHSQGGSGNQRFNTTPAQRKQQDDVIIQDPGNKKGSNQSLHKVAAPGSQSKSAGNNLVERSSSERVFEYVQNLQQQQKEHTRNDPLEEKSRSQRSDNYKSESSEGNLVSLPGMYKYESRGGSSHVVLGSEIDPSIFPLSMPPDLKKQMILALNQCVSVQDLIQTIFTFGYTPTTESQDILRGENQHLTSKVDNLKAENQYISRSLRESKELADELYITAKQYECNNELLTKAIRYADQGLQVYCALLCLYDNEHSIISINQRLADHEPLDYGLFISSQAIADLLVGSEQSLDLTMKRLYETRQKIEQNIRTVIGNYDSLPDIQRYLPIPLSHSSSHNSRVGHRSKRRSLGSSSPGNSSRNDPVSKDSSSGHGSMLSLSSHADSSDNELSPEDIKRMRQYIEVFHRLKKKVCSQMVPMNCALFDQRNKFELKVKSPDVRKDTNSSDQWFDLETAIHMQEISAVKEEKAKLQSQAYLLEQEMRIIEHKLCAAKDQEAASKQHIELLKHELCEQVRKKKKAQKELKAFKEQKTDISLGLPLHPDQGMLQKMVELKEAVERERWIRQKYYELMNTFDLYIARTQDRNEQLLSFVRDLKKANVALVSAYEKAKRKNQHLHKKLLNYVTQRDLDLPDPSKDLEPPLPQTPANKFTQL